MERDWYVARVLVIVIFQSHYRVFVLCQQILGAVGNTKRNRIAQDILYFPSRRIVFAFVRELRLLVDRG